MRVHYFSAIVVALAVTAFPAAAGFARSVLSVNNPVRITNTSCDLGYTSVSHRNTRIVFGVFNLGTVAHGFDIAGPYKTGLIQPGQEQTLVVNFGHPGAWKYACVAAHSTVKRGVFTIRKN
jgi:hypothetical protein